MTSRTILLFLLFACGAAGIGNAQSSSTNALFDRVSGSVCTIAAIDERDNLLRRGSGFILKHSRLLVTNAHVLAGFERAEVKCGDQLANVLRITNYDGEMDLVLAETGDLDVPGLELSAASDVRPGTQVYAFGSPYGLEGTITPGLTSAYRQIRGRRYIQISTPISPGSSGGPITDDRGAVIGVTVAALELAQNINFAIPASAIEQLPRVDLRLAELPSRRDAPAPPEPFEAPPRPEPAIASGEAEFHGHPFGTDCAEIAMSEYEQRLFPSKRKGLTKFSRSYSGQLEMEVTLYGAPATAVYFCDERFGMVGGRYEITGHTEAVARIENTIRGQYGAGSPNPISESEATELGCLFNFSLPGSRFYRPSTRTTWIVDERLRIDLLVCGGKSNRAFVLFGDPVLARAAS